MSHRTRDFDGLMEDRRRGVMHVPYEGRVSRRWKRYTRTGAGMQTLRQARSWQQQQAAWMTRAGAPERLGWSEATR